jgi:copper resistance protein B
MKHVVGAIIAILVLIFPISAFAEMPMGEPTDAAPFGSPISDERIYYHAMLDQLEGRFGADNSFRWEGEAWAGTDTNRIWLKSEGQTDSKDGVEDGQHELLYDRPISTYFDLQGGVRLDTDSRSGRTWAALGFEGLAPLFFHVSVAGYASSEGHYAVRIEGDYDLLLTQRLILQPQLELNLYSKSDPVHGIGSGLSELDSGLRLRYEFSRKFAPYIGMTYENRFGDAAAFARAIGGRASALRLTVGLRAWL